MPITMEAARRNAKLTQAEIAEMLGVSRITYMKWETGQAEMRPAYFIAFCAIVGMNTDDIFMPKGLHRDNFKCVEYAKRNLNAGEEA